MWNFLIVLAIVVGVVWIIDRMLRLYVFPVARRIDSNEADAIGSAETIWLDMITGVLTINPAPDEGAELIVKYTGLKPDGNSGDVTETFVFDGDENSKKLSALPFREIADGVSK